MNAFSHLVSNLFCLFYAVQNPGPRARAICIDNGPPLFGWNSLETSAQMLPGDPKPSLPGDPKPSQADNEDQVDEEKYSACIQCYFALSSVSGYEFS